MSELTPETARKHLRGETWESFFGISPGCATMGKPVSKKLDDGNYEITWPMTITTGRPISSVIQETIEQLSRVKERDDGDTGCQVWSRSGCDLYLEDGRHIWWPRRGAPVWVAGDEEIELTDAEVLEFGDEYKHTGGIRVDAIDP